MSYLFFEKLSNVSVNSNVFLPIKTQWLELSSKFFSQKIEKMIKLLLGISTITLDILILLTSVGPGMSASNKIIKIYLIWVLLNKSSAGINNGQVPLKCSFFFYFSRTIIWEPKRRKIYSDNKQ